MNQLVINPMQAYARRIFLTIILLVASHTIYPQRQAKISHLLSISDKLSIKGLWTESIQIRQHLLRQNPSEEVKATLLNKIGSDLRHSERYDEAQKYLERGFQLAAKINFQKGQADALYQLGDLAYVKWAYFRSDSVNRALQLVNHSMEIYERLKNSAARWVRDRVNPKVSFA